RCRIEQLAQACRPQFQFEPFVIVCNMKSDRTTKSESLERFDCRQKPKAARQGPLRTLKARRKIEPPPGLGRRRGHWERWCEARHCPGVAPRTHVESNAAIGFRQDDFVGNAE